MTFRASDRVLPLLAFACASILCGLMADANAARLPTGEAGKASSPQLVSVQQVQSILADATGKPDAQVARQLSALELTEKMSDARLQSLQQGLPGRKSSRALLALADASVFLRPAPSDVLAQTRPDRSEQKRLMALTLDYLAKTLPKLPDFYATRTTVRFESGRSKTGAGASSGTNSSWRMVGRSKALVAYRDGKEVVDPGAKYPHRPESEGLVTSGAFGPILSTVIGDAAYGSIGWDRWERGGEGTLAVFHYRVPKERSHYSAGFHGLTRDGENADPLTAYHGEVAIDPASGAILFLTVQADQPLGSAILSADILRADIMVQYGPVEIGGRTYTCPVRSVSIFLGENGFAGGRDPFGRPTPPPATRLNDVIFDDYHLFHSAARILPGYIPAPDH